MPDKPQPSDDNAPHVVQSILEGAVADSIQIESITQSVSVDPPTISQRLDAYENSTEYRQLMDEHVRNVVPHAFRYVSHQPKDGWFSIWLGVIFIVIGFFVYLKFVDLKRDPDHLLASLVFGLGMVGVFNVGGGLMTLARARVWLKRVEEYQKILKIERFSVVVVRREENKVVLQLRSGERCEYKKTGSSIDIVPGDIGFAYINESVRPMELCFFKRYKNV
jgi:hypothetical protein